MAKKPASAGFLQLDNQICFAVYSAGHAFNRDVDPAVWHEPSARLAYERTLAFLHLHLAGGAE